MNLRLRTPLVLLAMLFGLVVVGLAGAAFTSPFYFSPAAQDANSADASVSPSGKAFVVWQRWDQSDGHTVVEMRTRTAPAGTFSQPQILSTNGHDAEEPHVASWSNGCVVVWQLQRGDVASTTPVQGKTCASNGALGPLFTVAPHPGGSFSVDAYPRVAVDASGKAFFTWAGLDANQKDRVYARTRTAGGTLGPVMTLSPPTVYEVHMAVNANGAAVFTWTWHNPNDDQNYIEARQLSAGGTLGPIKIIAAGISFSGGGGAGTGNPAAGIDGQGNSYIVWEQPDGKGACGINGCPKILGRTLSASGTVGSVPQTFTTTIDGGRYPQIAMTANGNAFVVWKHAGIEGRSRSAAGALGPLQKLTISTSADNPQLKGDASGNTVAAWQGGSVTQVRARTAGGTLGPLRSFSIAGQSAPLMSLGVGSGGQALVTWVQSDGLGQCSGGSSCSRIGAAAGP